MGEKDICEKTLMSYNEVFADIVNVLLFNGRRILREEYLEEHSTRSAYKADGKLRDVDRDVAKYETHHKFRIKISCVGFENQTEIDPDMPIRTIGYDGADYRAQMNADKKGKKVRYPVITIVLYFGMKRWKKPRRLSDCFKVPKRYRPYFNDYELHVFEIAYLTDEQVKMFKSDFRIVADYFVQMRKNKEYKPDDTTIRHVEEVLHLLSVFSGDNRFEDVFNSYADSNSKESGSDSMNDILGRYLTRRTNEMVGEMLVKTREEGKAEGRVEGRAEGKAEGRAEGKAEGRAEGKAEGRAEGLAEGEAIGIAKGRAEANINIFIRGALEFGADEELLLTRVMTEFPVTREEAIEIIKNVKAML